MLNFQRPAVLFLIKRSLGSFLKGDLDATQVDARIGAGFLELRDLKLDCDYISSFLGFTGLEVVDGFVSRIEVQVDWGTFCARIGLEEVLVTVRPRESLACERESHPAPPPQDEQEGVFKQQSMMDYLLKKLKVVLIGLTVRLEDMSVSQKALVVHGKRVACGFESDELPELDECESQPSPTFSAVFEGMSVEVWDDKHDAENSRNVELAALEGGQIQLTTDTLLGCVERHLDVTLGSGGVSVEASLIEYLKEGIDIACGLVSRCASTTEIAKQDNSRCHRAAAPYSWLASDDDDDEFFDCRSCPGTPMNSQSEGMSASESSLAEPSESQQSCVHVHCTSPLLYFSLNYLPDKSADMKEGCGGLDLFLEKINLSASLQAEPGTTMELSVGSIVGFERLPPGETQLSPQEAQDLVARLQSAPARLREFVVHGSQLSVNSTGSANVLPLLQLGFHGTDRYDKSGKSSLVMQMRQPSPDSVEVTVRSEPVAIWCSCSSLKNILTLVDILKYSLEKSSQPLSSISISEQAQKVINDIDCQGCPVEKSCKGKLVVCWLTPVVSCVIEKRASNDGRRGLFFGQWICNNAQGSSRDHEAPFLRFETSQEGKNIRSRAGGGKIENLKIQAALVEIFNVTEPTKTQGGILSCILQFNNKRFGCTSHSTFSHRLDAAADARAVDIELRVRPEYFGHSMVEAADSFLDWHSADRWTEENRSWNDKGTYREVEFQAKCVDNAKVFVGVHTNAAKAHMTHLDIEDISELLTCTIPHRENDTTTGENQDQVALLVTGSIDCSLRSPQLQQPHLDSSGAEPSNYQIVIEDIGFLQTKGLSGKHNSAMWVWSRGIRMSGGPGNTCSLFVPAPLDSQLPNPPGIEFALIGKSTRSANGDDECIERTSWRFKGITVTTDIDDLDFSLLRGVAQYSPSGKSKSEGVPDKKETCFALNFENIGLRCEPRRGWLSTEECPLIAGAVYMEGANCSSSSSAESHSIVTHSLSAHLAHCEKREHRNWDVYEPVDLQQIRLQQEGYCCVAREGMLRVGLHFAHPEPGSIPKQASVSVDIGNQQLLATFSHESLCLATCFVRQLQGTVPAETVSEMAAGGQTSKRSDKTNLLEALDENAFRHKPLDSMLASECTNGTWSEGFLKTGGIVDDWVSDFPSSAACPSEPVCTPDLIDSPQGIWLDGAPPEVYEDYIPESSADSSSFQNGGSGCLRLLDEHPVPNVTVHLQDLSVTCILTDRSMRKEDRIDLEIQGLSARIDSFPDGSHYVWRTALQVQCFELRDCRDAAHQAWRSILSRQIRLPKALTGHHGHGLATPMLEFTLEAVQPNEKKLLEDLRVKIVLVPLRLRLDQAIIKFLVGFIDSIPRTPETANQIPIEEVPFFQICEVEALHLVVDYLPRRLDIGSLRSGNLVEVMNFVRWGGVKLNLKEMKLAGLLGWDSLFAAMIQEWQKEVIGKQVHKFFKGIPPVRSILRIGSACQNVLFDSIESIVQPARSVRDCSHVPGRSRLRQSSLELLRVVVLEALNAGAAVAAGAQIVLLGSVDGVSNYKPGGTVTPGFYQARACVESAFDTIVKEPVESYKNGEGAGPLLLKTLWATPAAMVAPATAAATALHCTLVGCKNKLDVDRTLDN